MTKLEIEPFMLGDAKIHSVEVRKMNFVEFVNAAANISEAKEYNRARMLASVTLNGSPITKEQIPLLPIRAGKAILELMNDDSNAGKPGEVLSEKADGIEKPILYKLGTPLKMKRGKEDVFITELEFHAKTYGDVEDIIASDHRLNQTLEMLKRIAVPVGIKNLTILPEATLSQLTVADGLKIALSVTENFIL